jgi:hypothetical protein
MAKLVKESKSIDQTVQDLKELLEYQDRVLGTADKLLKTKDYLIEVLELQKEVYITENKILRATCLGLCIALFAIVAVRVVSFIL